MALSLKAPTLTIELCHVTAHLIFLELYRFKSLEMHTLATRPTNLIRWNFFTTIHLPSPLQHLGVDPLSVELQSS